MKYVSLDLETKEWKWVYNEKKAGTMVYMSLTSSKFWLTRIRVRRTMFSHFIIHKYS